MFMGHKNKSMKLHRVKLVKHETCKSFAFKRVGLSHLLSMDTDKPRIEDLAEGKMFKHLREPKKGALLLWLEGEERYYNETVEIDEDGRIISDRMMVYGHLGVYEGKGLVSDVIGGDLYPIVRVRKYKDLRKPDYILKPMFKKNK